MQILDSHDTEKALPWTGMRDALISVLLAQTVGEAHCPVRNRLDVGTVSDVSSKQIPTGVLLTMPASDAHIAVVKVVTVHPANSQRDPPLPVVQAAVLVMDANTGERLAMLDGEVVTERRTAALSALAVERISATRDHAQASLLVIGAGAQARAHILAFSKLLGVKNIQVQARRSEQVKTLIAWGQSIGIHIEHAQPESLACADLIITATNSMAPVIADSIKAGAIVCGVGAFTSKMAELPASLVRRSLCVVDTLEGCRTEAGDLLQADIDWSEVKPLHQFRRAPTPGRHQPTVFKSVGSALWDLAAAKCFVLGASLK